MPFPTRFILLSLSVSGGRSLNSFNLRWWLITVCSVFWVIALSFSTLKHSLILNSSFFFVHMSSVISIDAIVVYVFSAYIFAFRNSKQLSKSVRYIMKRRGPKHNPWGIPLITFSILELWPFRGQNWFLPLRCDLSHLIAFPSILLFRQFIYWYFVIDGIKYFFQV